jgi:xanthine dehydrogenase accessory factor
MFAQLRDRGVPRDALARVRSPVGVPIGAETPAEIAVSIVAEIVRETHPSPLGTSTRDVSSPTRNDDVLPRTP